MAFDAYMQKAVLDWVLGGATPTRPVGRFMGYASGSPTSVNDSAAPFPRLTATFAAANSPTGSVTNVAAFTGSFTSINTINCWNLYDAAAAGNRLLYGTLTAAQTGTVGQTVACNAGGLKIILS